MAGNRKANKSNTPQSARGKAKKICSPQPAKAKPVKEKKKTKLLNDAIDISSSNPQPAKAIPLNEKKIEIIDISSSYQDSHFNINERKKECNSSEASTPIGGHVNNIASAPDCTPPPNGIEELKLLFNNIATLIAASNTNLRFTMSPSGVPLVVSDEKHEHGYVPEPKTDTNFEPESKVPHRQTWKTLKKNMTKRTLFSKYEPHEDNDFYINYQPLASFGHEGRTIGVDIPQWIPVSFRPPFDMVLDDIEAAVAAYIFMTDDDNDRGGEILIKTTTGIGDRKALKTLMPRGWVDQEVINLLAFRLRQNEKLLSPKITTWFLPTMFAQYALDWNHSPENLMNNFKEDFMGKLDYLQKLLVLDSLPCPERNQYIRIKVPRLALVLQQWTNHFMISTLQECHIRLLFG